MSVTCRRCGQVAHLIPEEMAACTACDEVVHAHPEYTAKKRAPAAPEYEDPAAIAEEIVGELRGALGEIEALEQDLAATPAPIDASPTTAAWVVFVPASDGDDRPAIVAAPNRWAAERAVSTAFRVSPSRCYAVPFSICAVQACADPGHEAWHLDPIEALPIDAHPRRRTDPMSIGDAIDFALGGAVELAEEENKALYALHATILGCEPEEVEQKMAEERAAKARGAQERKSGFKVRRQAAPKNAVKPAPGAAAIEAGLRQLTERQRELLALVDVDPRTNRVVYTRNEHVPDWAALKQAVEALGGKWLGKSKKTKGGWVFGEDVDAMDAITTARETGAILDPLLLGYFPTPEPIADALVARLDIRPGDRVLEPSAGKGALALAVRRACPEARIVCVELLPENAAELRRLGFEVIEGDFLAQSAETLGSEFDAIVSNPPFGKGRVELHHLRHMMEFLRVGGRLGAVMPNSLFFRDDTLTESTRELLDHHGVSYVENGPGAFRESGTMVSTVSLALTKAAT